MADIGGFEPGIPRQSRSIQTTLPRPATTKPWKTVNPRRLAPLEPPPVTLADYPALPCPPRDPSFCPGYRVTTHVFPAAFPRCPSDPWVPPRPGQFASKESATAEVRHLSSLKIAQEEDRDPRPPRREVLWTVANRYVRTLPTRTPGLTIVMLHYYGGHKEVRGLRVAILDLNTNR